MCRSEGLKSLVSSMNVEDRADFSKYYSRENKELI